MIRIFVGTSPNGEDIESQAVLDYTLRKHASEPLEITWMRLLRDPGDAFYSDGKNGWQTQLWSTPFSGFRWAVPELCAFKGRAIYMDSDIIVRADIAELWGQEFQRGKVVMGKGGYDAWRFCVSLWDCERAAAYMLPLRKLMSDPKAHRGMVQKFRGAPFVQAFSGDWNNIDGERLAHIDDPTVKAIHYSSEAHQPHLHYAVPRLAREGRKHWFDGPIKPHWRKDLVQLFDSLLVQAEVNGFRRQNYMPAEPFGDYKLASHAGYRSHRFAPAHA